MQHLVQELAALEHRVSTWTVENLLRAQGLSQQANSKQVEGRQHPDRDAQFSYLNARAMDQTATGDPVICVDTKKKELIGEFKNDGREWHPKGVPRPVNVHDFKDRELGRVNPYGVYDVTADAGWVSVGVDHDTPAFAVNPIRSWWDVVGRRAYPGAERLLITADGGSNGYRTRLWKTELAALATETGLRITVCHLPPGTSKWNKIEHRLPYLDALASPPPDQPRGRRQHHRRDHHCFWRPRRSRPRHGRVPRRHIDPRQADARVRGQRGPHPPRLARRMELHP